MFQNDRKLSSFQHTDGNGEGERKNGATRVPHPLGSTVNQILSRVFSDDQMVFGGNRGRHPEVHQLSKYAPPLRKAIETNS